ncbi:hypothetical protein Y032_0038g3611 [Ancylostoma ceylanicum]|uniref:Uncharacterized protein n=1 Tax=Ancylostoma ceylanicum TaxID=53326 RepID=A0A016UKR5_9BILA|nr:hypothetical protein Y032_0038g3611 [Ancylostoma ceylanicum]
MPAFPITWHHISHRTAARYRMPFSTLWTQNSPNKFLEPIWSSPIPKLVHKLFPPFLFDKLSAQSLRTTCKANS